MTAIVWDSTLPSILGLVEQSIANWIFTGTISSPIYFTNVECAIQMKNFARQMSPSCRFYCVVQHEDQASEVRRKCGGNITPIVVSSLPWKYIYRECTLCMTFVKDPATNQVIIERKQLNMRAV